MNTPNMNLMPWLTEKFITAAPEAACKALEALATHEALILLKPLKSGLLITCLNGMDSAKASAILRRFPSRQAAHILSKLSLPQAVQIYQAFSIPQREKMKTLLEASWVALLERGKQWAPESAGAHMSRDFTLFKTETPVGEIIEKLKTIPRRKLPAVCLITSGKENKLKGSIRTAELAFFAPHSLAGAVMSELKSIPVAAPAEQARALLVQGQMIVPVTDEAGSVLGVISAMHFLETPSRKKRFNWF